VRAEIKDGTLRFTSIHPTLTVGFGRLNGARGDAPRAREHYPIPVARRRR
jgi:hypothetical protein